MIDARPYFAAAFIAEPLSDIFGVLRRLKRSQVVIWKKREEIVYLFAEAVYNAAVVSMIIENVLAHDFQNRIRRCRFWKNFVVKVFAV